MVEWSLGVAVSLSIFWATEVETLIFKIKHCSVRLEHYFNYLLVYGCLQTVLNKKTRKVLFLAHKHRCLLRKVHLKFILL